MHFHLPKPMHGWRAFVGEVAIIVLGVLIALGAEQAVERWRWQEDVKAGREALRLDFESILVNAGEREAEDKCIRDRLLFLRNLLDSHPDRLPALGHVGSPPARSWYPTSWDSLVASNVSAHLDRDDLLAFGNIAQQARLAEETAFHEIDDWTVIYTMVGPARPLAAGEASQIRKALTDAAFRLNTMRLVAPQIGRAINETKMLTKEDQASVGPDVKKVLGGVNARHICGPIALPDSNRVDAPYDPAVQRDPLYGTGR